MIRQGFDPLLNPLEQLVHFCECLEATLQISETRGLSNETKRTNKENKKGVAKTGKCWDVHKRTSHNTEDCLKVKNWKAQTQGKQPPFGNKMWKCKSNPNQSKSGDLNMVVRKSQEQLNKIKRDLHALAAATLTSTNRATGSN